VLADGLKGGVFVHSNGKAELLQTLVVKSAMAGVHVKWGGVCRVEACTVREGHQAGVLVEGDVSLIHVVDSVVVGNRGHALLAMDGGHMVVERGRGRGSVRDAEANKLGTHELAVPAADADDVKCCRGGLVSRTADNGVSSRVPHTLFALE